MNFSERLKTLRKQKDLTQEQLAEYMGVSPQAVSRWETGATCPDIMALPQLAELFHITIDELLGVNEKETRRKINEIIAKAESKINQNITEDPIKDLRRALIQYPNNDRLLCCLMYALYAAAEDAELCKQYDEEITSIGYRLLQYSTDSDCRNEARRLLFRHYCDTNRKMNAMQLADDMASIETCIERNIYWALDEADRCDYLKERILDDLRQLLWDIWAYSIHSSPNESDKFKLDQARIKIESVVKELGL